MSVKKIEYQQKDYSFYLFTKLHDWLYPSEEPYDVQFEYLEFLYNRYLNSKENNPNIGEYECMVDYLKKNAPEEELDCLCSSCNGTGEGPASGTRCTSCNGSGVEITTI